MAAIRVSLHLLLATLSMTQVSGSECAEGWKEFSQIKNGTCYKRFCERKNFNAAQAHCMQLGGSLAKLDSYDLNANVRHMILGTPSFWAGGSEQGEAEGNWKWMDSKPFNWTNWNQAKKQPDNARGVDEECLMVGYTASTSEATIMLGLLDTSWYDVPCCLELPYVCEVQAPGQALGFSPYPGSQCMYQYGAHFECPHDYAADEKDAIDLILWLTLVVLASVVVLVAGAYFIHSIGEGSDAGLQESPPAARVNQMMQAQPVTKAGIP